MRYFVKSAAIAAMLLAPDASQAVVIISDSTFNNGDWAASLIPTVPSGSSLSFSAVQQGSGGNPDSFRTIQHSWTGPGGIIAGHRFTGAGYNPSIQGAITDLDFSLDGIHIDFSGSGVSPGAIAFGALVSQNGNTFIAGFGIALQNGGWTSLAFNDLTAASISSSLDFSSAGGLIEFGYYTSNGSAFSGTHVTNGGVDNWQVTINQAPLVAPGVPEPMTLSLLGAGLLVLGAMRRKRD